MGVAKAALEATSRYLARDLGPRGVRVNLVSAGPLGTLAARGIPGFGELATRGSARRRSAGTPTTPRPSPAVLFLLCDVARAITGEILHVDGGFHAMGRPRPGARGGRRMKPPSVFLTGATGFVGTEVLARLLERGDRDVVALVRAPDREAAEARLEGVLATLWRDPSPYRARVRAVPGDVTRPGLGIDPAERAHLAEEVGAVLHCAASISFDLPLDEARAINVEGTREVIGFARECRSLGRSSASCTSRPRTSPAATAAASARTT